MNQKCTQSGFTLIEMMVSVALFAVVISVALPTMLVVVKASARAQALQTTIDNTSFSIDAMSRQVRLGREYHCTDESIVATLWKSNPSEESVYNTAKDCENGASTLIFTNQDNVRQAFRYNSASSTLESWHAGTSRWITFTSPRVLVKQAAFTVRGARVHDGVPSVAQFAMLGASRDEVAVPEFTLSTSMAQYLPERGFVIRRLRQGDQGMANIGSLTGTSFGSAITSLDFSGDNVLDLVVGMRARASNQGGAYALRMNRNGTVQNATLLASNSGGMPTLTAGEQFGASVVSVGDIDGDDAKDIVFGAPGAGVGAVYLATMQASGDVTMVQKLTAGGTNMPALAAGDEFGASLTNMSIRNIAIGAPGSDTACTNCGAVYLLTFNRDRTVAQTTPLTATSLGLNSNDAFGSGVAFVGYTTNGQRLLAVGAPGVSCPAFGAACGAVYLLTLADDNTISSSLKLENGGQNMPQLSAGARFGASVSAAGDLNGDGVLDLLVGAEETGGTGSLYLFFLKSDNTILETRRITSDQNGGPTLGTGDAFGRAGAFIGDLNNDGRFDTATGAPGNDALYILFGK